jgi:hypothetical protein
MFASNSLLRWWTAVVPITLSLTISLAASAAATITSLSPSSVVAGGTAFTLTINGRDFTSTSTLKWGAAALKTDYKSATQLTTTVPASLIATAITATISVHPGLGTSSSALFTVDSSPSAVAGPASAVAGGMTLARAPLPSAIAREASISAPVSTSTFTSASTSASALAVADSEKIAVNQQLPAVIGPSPDSTATPDSSATIDTSSVLIASGSNPASTVPSSHSATNVVNAVSSGSTLAASSSLPTVASLSPSSVAAGTQAFTLTVNGANFISGALATVVRWSNTALTTTYVSSTQVTAAVPASLFTAPGTVNISVVTAGGASSSVAFTVNPAQPVITSTSPSSLRVNSGTIALVVYGSYFSLSATVNWGATPLVTTYLQGSILSALVPASLMATAGPVSVTVTTAGGTSAPLTFTVTPSQPLITSLSPASAPAGSAKFTLTINGNGFIPSSFSSLGTPRLVTTYVSPTQLTAVVPASLLTSPGVSGVTVYSPYGGGWSPASTFTISPAPPSITSLNPASVCASSSGLSLTVMGADFTPSTTLSWGSTPLDPVYVSPTELLVDVPPNLFATQGTATITAGNAQGTSVPVSYTINPPAPQIWGLSTNLATAGQGAFTLAIYGSNLTPASVAKWGSTSLATTYVSATELTAAIPANLTATTGMVYITVTTTTGASGPIPLTIGPAIQITTATLPSTIAGNPYSAPITVTGGNPGYNWTVTGLPGFLTFDTTFDHVLTITGTPPSTGSFTFQVSVEDTVGAVAGPITYTVTVGGGPNGANNGNLNGTYVCLLQGFMDGDGTSWASVASFQTDGQGNITNGVFDTNSYDIGSGSGILSGSYSIGSDNSGMASIHTILTDGPAGNQTVHWAVALSGAAQPAQQFRMIEADDLGTWPSGDRNTANCYRATPSAFAASTINGQSIVFGLDGEDNNGNLKASAGLFSAAGGTVASGNIDVALGGSATVQTSAFTGTYSTPDPAAGRFTIALDGAGTSTGFTVYIIDANRMFVLDNSQNDGEQAGNARVQQQVATSGASLSGPFVLYLRGAEFSGGGSTPSGYYATVSEGSGDGAGNLTINQSYTNDSGSYSAANANAGPTGLAFDSAHPGRASFQSAGGTSYFYFFSTNSALEMSVGNNGSFDSGWLEPQTQANFTGAALAGDYAMGQLPLLSNDSLNSTGEFDVASSGAIAGGLSTAGQGVFSWDQSIAMTYSWDTTAPGTGTFLVADSLQGGASCAVINATRFACTPQTDSSPGIEVFEE